MSMQALHLENQPRWEVAGSRAHESPFPGFWDREALHARHPEAGRYKRLGGVGGGGEVLLTGLQTQNLPGGQRGCRELELGGGCRRQGGVRKHRSISQVWLSLVLGRGTAQLRGQVTSWQWATPGGS